MTTSKCQWVCSINWFTGKRLISRRVDGFFGLKERWRSWNAADQQSSILIRPAARSRETGDEYERAAAAMPMAMAAAASYCEEDEEEEDRLGLPVRQPAKGRAGR